MDRPLDTLALITGCTYPFGQVHVLSKNHTHLSSKRRRFQEGNRRKEKKRHSHRKVRKNKDQGKKRGPQNEQSFDSLALRRW
jgi:hypothetical protein